MKNMMKILLLILISSPLVFGASIKTAQDSYPKNAIITVNVTNLPATPKCDLDKALNECSWVGLFYAFDDSAPENLLASSYATQSGDVSFSFPGLDEPQSYEARLFYKNSYQEEGSYNFAVTSQVKKIDVKSLKKSYQTNASISVHFSGFPGNKNDWIGIFKAYDVSKAENLITKLNTNGLDEGDLSFPAIQEVGEYEVRAFKNGTFDEEDYYPFEVVSIPSPISACNILQNSSFETGTNGWNVYAGSSLTNDAYAGNKALKINNSGLDQMSQKITAPVNTYQFNGYYKTVGKSSGIWAGMVFYDEDKNVIFEKSIFLKDVHSYTQFVINATATPQTKYIEAWFWADGEVKLDSLRVSTLACYNYRVASALPPKGLKPNQVPQFVVLGFDDNTKSEGIHWFIDSLFKNKKNHDGSDVLASFYANTVGLHVYKEDEPASLIAAMKDIVSSGFELGNHTDTHFTKRDGESETVFFKRISTTSRAIWEKRIGTASKDLVELVGMNEGNIRGFRSPYLLYNQNTFETLKAEGYLYDCSVEDGYSAEFDGTNFRWPYVLNGGSPGHYESWYGNPDNPGYVDIKPVEGLWELPLNVLMIPKDSECAKYNIKTGLWKRMKKNLPYLEDYKMTNLDYNLWSEAKINKKEMLGILKYNLDLRLKGNRAPLMIGVHSQYYTKEWADENAPNATVIQMKEAISEFVDYALSKEAVRMTTGANIIEWCKNPQAL